MGEVEKEQKSNKHLEMNKGIAEIEKIEQNMQNWL